MNKELFEVAVISHAVGFLMGAILTYFVLRWMKQLLIDHSQTVFTAADLKEWLYRDKEIQNINLQTRNVLDRLLGNGS